jgi:hypothetical protein
MTANKLKVAGAAAAVLIIGAAALTIGQQGGFGSAVAGRGAASQDTAAPAGAANTPGSAHAQTAKPSARKPGDKPLWRTLTPAQQVALQPLQAEWDPMDGVRKQKWLQLANRFGALAPEEQERVHERMREWVKLTPEQRELARETYTRTRKIAPDQKTASWENYQQLPEAQKQKLAASSTGRKPASVVPAQANANANGKAVAPLNQGSAACPAGMVKNGVSASPPCVPPGPVPTTPALPGQTPASPAPANPATPQQQEKPVPANWGITPNNA